MAIVRMLGGALLSCGWVLACAEHSDEKRAAGAAAAGARAEEPSEATPPDGPAPAPSATGGAASTGDPPTARGTAAAGNAAGMTDPAGAADTAGADRPAVGDLSAISSAAAVESTVASNAVPGPSLTPSLGPGAPEPAVTTPGLAAPVLANPGNADSGVAGAGGGSPENRLPIADAEPVSSALGVPLGEPPQDNAPPSVVPSANTAVETTDPVDGFTVTNPLIKQRADPWITHHTDGSYYFTATVPEYDRIPLRRAASIPELAAASETVVWSKHPSGEMAAHIWAPELHFVNGRWILYFAAGRSDDVWAIRIYALENPAADPLTDSWIERGQVTTDWQSFSLDATTFEHDGVRYLVWAQSDPNGPAHNTNIYIASLSSPFALSSPQVLLSKSDYPWEQVQYPVNEGPAVLKRHGRVFISYSASATDANYSVGLLWANETDDLLQQTSWHKAAEPVLASGNGVYGPGHNAFTASPEGSLDILVYHARDYEFIDGDPLNDPNRHTRVQELRWDSEGMPLFGPPQANGTVTIGTID